MPKLIKNSNYPWSCIKCCKQIFPFTDINNYKLSSVFSDKTYCDLETEESSLILKPPSNLKSLLNEFNNFTPERNDSSDNIIDCKYYDINQIKKLSHLNYKKFSFSFPTKYLFTSKTF